MPSYFAMICSAVILTADDAVQLFFMISSSMADENAGSLRSDSYMSKMSPVSRTAPPSNRTRTESSSICTWRMTCLKSSSCISGSSAFFRLTWLSSICGLHTQARAIATPSETGAPRNTPDLDPGVSSVFISAWMISAAS